MDNFTATPEMIKLATDLSRVMAMNCYEEWILCGIDVEGRDGHISINPNYFR